MHKFLWTILLLPLAGALINGLLGRALGRRVVAWIGVGTVAGSFALALKALVLMKAAPGLRLETAGPLWMAAGPLSVNLGLVFDPLGATMALLVSGISLLIHLYSVGYMAEDKGFARFFAYLNLFVFFMLTLVLGSSLPMLFIGWEGVGLCSYLLIGFAFDTDLASKAGLKAILFNRVGDLGVIVGMLALFGHFGTLDLGPLLQGAGRLSPEAGFGILTFATLMLFLGATGKSAQIPLYLWLPDAMAGPTPVSALIHAATMVTAGIFLVCRLAPVFQLAPITLNVIAVIGAATALVAATMGLCQRDIKKVLAYSTISQLGYMFLGLGAAGFAAGFFHVFTHAWFKALLFLGAGSVIHALHARFHGHGAHAEVPPEQDLFLMGGLRKQLPVTFWTMAVATLAILGIPPFAGFFSKDEILYLAFLKHPALWAAGLLGACLTAFYMVRLMTLAFFGESRTPEEVPITHAEPAVDAEDAPHLDAAPSPAGLHESPWTMTLPLGLLAVGSALAGFWGIPEAFGGHFAIGKWLAPSLTYGQTAGAAAHSQGPALALAVLSTALVLASGAFAWFTYRHGLATAQARAAAWPRLHAWVAHVYFVDEAVETGLLRPVRWLGNLFWKLFDVILIDGIGINLPARLTQLAGDFVALLQTGRVRNYALAMALGVLGLLFVFLR